jgi:hypothetical protein
LLVLSTNNWDCVKAGLASILTAIAEVKPGGYAHVTMPAN